MKRALLLCLLGLVVFAGVALWPREYARVASPDGRHVAIAKYRAYQDWTPSAPGDAGSKDGWILIVAKDGSEVFSGNVDRVAQIQELRWTPDAVELPQVFASSLR